MKNSLALVLLAVAPLVSLAPSVARAQFEDYGCSAKLEMPNGKVKKTYLARKSAQRLGSLNLYFAGGVYDGVTPIFAAFKIEDRYDKSENEILTSEITRHWQWEFARQTKYGRLTVVCE